MKIGGISYTGHFYRTRPGILIALTFFAVLFVNCSVGFSQGKKVVRTASSRERAQEFINDFTNPLGIGDDLGHPRHRDGRDPSGQGQVDVNALRPLIRTFADKMTQLTYALNDQMSQLTGIRRYYTEGLRLSGAAASIQKRAEKYGVDGAMLDDLQQLDADWREMAYGLRNVRGLSNDSIDLFADIDDIDQQIRQLIKIQPQFDRRQLNLKVAGLVADLDNLQEDINSELGRSQDSQYYRRSISRVRQVVMNLVSTLRDDRIDNGMIVEEYKQFATLWTPLAEKLRLEDDRYIERGLRRVAISAAEIHQLLLLPQKMDQSQFIHLAKALKKDIDQFFERTPLILVMRLPNSKEALPVADQFYNSCAQFIDVVTRSQDAGEIVESFKLIEQAQRAFNDVYQEVDSDRANAVLSRINQTVNSLRTSLQIQRDDFDYQSASDLAAAVQNYSDQIAITCRRWLDDERPSFANECFQEATALADWSGRLHDGIVDGKRPPELRKEMTEVYERCRHLYDYLARCQTEDRSTLVRLSSNLTPALNELRTMILP